MTKKQKQDNPEFISLEESNSLKKGTRVTFIPGLQAMYAEALKNICFAKEAIDYNFKLSFKKGLIIHHFSNNEDMTDCYSQFMGIYSDNFKKSRPLKISN